MDMVKSQENKMKEQGKELKNEKGKWTKGKKRKIIANQSAKGVFGACVKNVRDVEGS